MRKIPDLVRRGDGFTVAQGLFGEEACSFRNRALEVFFSHTLTYDCTIHAIAG